MCRSLHNEHRYATTLSHGRKSPYGPCSMGCTRFYRHSTRALLAPYLPSVKLLLSGDFCWPLLAGPPHSSEISMVCLSPQGKAERFGSSSLRRFDPFAEKSYWKTCFNARTNFARSDAVDRQTNNGWTAPRKRQNKATMAEWLSRNWWYWSHLRLLKPSAVNFQSDARSVGRPSGPDRSITFSPL